MMTFELNGSNIANLKVAHSLYTQQTANSKQPRRETRKQGIGSYVLISFI